MVPVPSQDRVAAERASGVKLGDDGRESLISLDGVTVVNVYVSVIFPCTIKVQRKISSGTGSLRCSQKKRAVKWLCVCVRVCACGLA